MKSFQNIVVRLLVECLRILLDLKEITTHSRYDHTKERKVLKDALRFLKGNGGE